MDRLQEMWNRQVELETMVHDRAGKTREQTITERQVALVTEVGELANELQSFKYWKHNKKIDVNKVKEEYADVLHFVLSLGIDIFEDPEDLFEWYKTKNEENLKRQNTGY